MTVFVASTIALVILIARTDLNFLEWCGLGAALFVSIARPDFGKSQWRRISARYQTLARRRTLCVIAVGLIALLLRLAFLPMIPVPEPLVSDEFSHRLLAETLLLGRASNPTHPMWAHMETIQVIQKPTYASMYLPGQAIFLAAGKVVAGTLWAGVALSVALMCGAICWALQGWLPPSWALAGGLIAVARFGLFSYWMNSYWGGAVAALGGALVIGAYPRIRNRAGVWSSIVMGVGVALLAVSRPYEGLVLLLPIAGAMLFWLLRLRGRLLSRACGRVAVPILCVVVVAGGLLGHYNAHVTGSPFRLAYTVNQQTYGWPMTLPWFQVKPHTHSVQVMHDYYLWELEEHNKVANAPGHIFKNLCDAVSLWSFFAGPSLGVFLVYLPRSLRDRRIRTAVFACGAGLAAVILEQTRYPHYLAPATAAFMVVLLQSARHMWAHGARNSPVLHALFRLIPLVIALVLVARVLVPPLRAFQPGVGRYWSWCCNAPGNLARAALLKQLEATAGDHLVIVRYGPQHDPLKDWVYNEPQVDRAKVVWARDMGESANRELVQYFRKRSAWLLEINDDGLRPSLAPYRIENSGG